MISEDFVVYTCVTHNYDSVKPVEVTENGVRFVCFTDQLNKVPRGWEGRPLQSPPRLCSGHDINRFHKIFPHRFFPEYRYSVYLDGNVSFKGDYGVLLDRFHASGAALGAFAHPKGRNISEEIITCKQSRKFDHYDLDRCEEQRCRYQEDDFDLSEIVTANYLLVRDHHHPKIELAMSVWWAQLFEFTKRDQISLNYVLWKTDLPWVFLDKDLGIDCELLYRRLHIRSVWEKIITCLISLIKMLSFIK